MGRNKNEKNYEKTVYHVVSIHFEFISIAQEQQYTSTTINSTQMLIDWRREWYFHRSTVPLTDCTSLLSRNIDSFVAKPLLLTYVLTFWFCCDAKHNCMGCPPTEFCWKFNNIANADSCTWMVLSLFRRIDLFLLLQFCMVLSLILFTDTRKLLFVRWNVLQRAKPNELVVRLHDPANIQAAHIYEMDLIIRCMMFPNVKDWFFSGK